MMKKMLYRAIDALREKRYHKIVSLIKARDAKSYLEVGVYDAKTFLYVVRHTDIDTYTGVDPYEASSYKGKVDSLMNLSQEDFDRIYQDVLGQVMNYPYKDVSLIRAPFEKAKDVLKGQKFDIIFIDGLHTYQDVVKDIMYAKGLVSDTGLILGHDYDIKTYSVIKAVDAVLGSDNIQTTIDKVWYYDKKIQ